MRAATIFGITLLLIAIAVQGHAQIAVVSMDDAFVVIPVGDNGDNERGGLDFSAFDYQRKNENILTGFPVGHNLPKATNELFYNLNLDGYGGLPFGSCLYRKETLGDTVDGVVRRYSADEMRICLENENKDLMRVWANRNPNLKNVLLKNMTIKNAFRTRNVVDGSIVTRSNQLPHTDTFQTFYSSSSEEDPEWLSIQDTIIRNSDNSLMISGGGRFKGAVYQNLETGCDEAFREDARARAVNDFKAYISTNPQELEDFAGGRYACNNGMSFMSTVPAPTWIIEIVHSGRVSVNNQGAEVIVIGSKDNGQPRRITHRVDRKVTTRNDIDYYDYIEDALAAGHARPPFIEMSCAGWRNPPKGCETRRGYLN